MSRTQMRVASWLKPIGDYITGAKYALINSPSVGYIGCVGQGNLGDDAMLLAIRLICPNIAWHSITPRGRSFDIATRIGLYSPRLFPNIVLGGGTLISRSWLPRVKALINRKRTLWCCGTGAGSVGWQDDENPDLKDWKDVLVHFKGIGVRGPLSKNLLERIGITSVEVCGDLALSLVKDQPTKPMDPPIIAVNISLPKNPFDPVCTKDLLNLLVKVINHRRQLGWRILLVVTDDRDIAATMNLCQRTSLSPQAILYNRDPQLLINKITPCMSLIGVRLHSAVLAVCAGVPPIMLGYRNKCLDFMLSMDLQRDYLALSSIDSCSLERMIETRLSFRNDTLALRKSLIERAQYWKRTQATFIKRMISFSE